jgi:hypothetical protein
MATRYELSTTTSGGISRLVRKTAQVEARYVLLQDSVKWEHIKVDETGKECDMDW